MPASIHLQRRWPAAAAPLSVLLALLAGCETPPVAGPPPDAPEPPAYADLASAQNGRVARLATVYARGVVEFRWTDEDGKDHSEPQVDADLWIQLPRRTALRLEKLGDVLLWLGSDEQRFWLFDLMSDETVLYSWPHEYVVEWTPAAISVRPLVMLDLMGLASLPPPGGPDEPPITRDPGRGRWIVECAGRSGPLRLHFDPKTLRPVLVEAMEPDGTIIASSRLERYRPVHQEGVSSLEFPYLAEIIRIRSGDGTSDVNLFLSDPDDAAGQRLDRVFDLARLRKSMPTDRIEGDLVTSPVASP